MSGVEEKNTAKERVISFKPLMKLLIERDMTTADLRRASGLNASTMTNIRASRSVTLETVARICNTLDCSIEDVVTIE